MKILDRFNICFFYDKMNIEYDFMVMVWEECKLS